MSLRTLCLGVAVVVGAGAACATAAVMGGGPLQEGTIEMWRDGSNTCHTKTSPYVRVHKRSGLATWKIVDKVDCVDPAEVEIKFDKGDADPLPSCSKKGKRKIQCPLAAAPVGEYKYSVSIGSEKEDPVLVIEQ